MLRWQGGRRGLIARPLGLQAQLTCASADYLARGQPPRWIRCLRMGTAPSTYLSASSGKSMPIHRGWLLSVTRAICQPGAQQQRGYRSMPAPPSQADQIPAFLVARSGSGGVEVLPEPPAPIDVQRALPAEPPSGSGVHHLAGGTLRLTPGKQHGARLHHIVHTARSYNST